MIRSGSNAVEGCYRIEGNRFIQGIYGENSTRRCLAMDYAVHKHIRSRRIITERLRFPISVRMRRRSGGRFMVHGLGSRRPTRCSSTCAGLPICEAALSAFDPMGQADPNVAAADVEAEAGVFAADEAGAVWRRTLVVDFYQYSGTRDHSESRRLIRLIGWQARRQRKGEPAGAAPLFPDSASLCRSRREMNEWHSAGMITLAVA
jgi:hypothetical protein